MSQEVEMKEREPLQVEDGKAQVIKMSDAQNGGAGSPTRAAPGVAFAGMTKEELMQFANDPFWIRIRWFLFILFWLIWFGMIAGAVVVIITAPKCPVKPDKTVLEEKAVVYIPKNAFQDRTGQAPDYLNSVTAELANLKSTGMEGVWIERFEDLQDPMDIDNVKPEVVNFLKEAKAGGEAVLIEINPNRTPLKHPWFTKSAKKEDKFADFYIWRNNPNNWLTANSGTGTSAWKKDPTRNEYYYFAEAEGNADLNLRNPLVVQEVEKIFKFWLENDAAGFVVSGTRYLFEDPEFKSAADSANATLRASGGYEGFNFDGVTRDLPENRELLAAWKKVIDESKPEGSPGLMIVKNPGPGKSTNGSSHLPPAHAVVAEAFGSLSVPLTGFAVSEAVQSSIAAQPAEGETVPFALWPVAFQQRPIDALKDQKLVDAFVALAALLPGSPVYNFDQAALEKAKEEGSEMSKLMKLRSENGIKFGSFVPLTPGKDHYGFVRIFGKSGFVVIIYLGEEPVAHLDATIYNARIPDTGVMSFRTGEAVEFATPEKETMLSSITVNKNELVVISFEPKPAE